jgi:hypothetical protein
MALLSKIKNYTNPIFFSESEEVTAGQMAGGLENHVNCFDVETVELIVELQGDRAHHIPKYNAFTWLSEALARSLLWQSAQPHPIRKAQR